MGKNIILKKIENTLTKGTLFFQKRYLCNADRCLPMQPLAEKCFYVTRRGTIFPQKSGIEHHTFLILV
jgi:hypothetical protein